MINYDLKVRRTRRNLNDYFKIYKIESSEKRDRPLIQYLTFDPNNYWIYKTTGKQKEVSYEEFLDFKHSGYTFFKKDLYNKDDINKWIDFLYSFTSIPYLSKPLPPIEYIQKIKIK